MQSNLEGMTQAKWNSLTAHQREQMRDYSDLRPELSGLEGYRVEVLDADGEKRRFIVGRSTGWRPVHLEIERCGSRWGGPCDSRGYKVLRVLEYVR